MRRLTTLGKAPAVFAGFWLVFGYLLLQNTDIVTFGPPADTFDWGKQYEPIKELPNVNRDGKKDRLDHKPRIWTAQHRYG